MALSQTHPSRLLVENVAGFEVTLCPVLLPVRSFGERLNPNFVDFKHTSDSNIYASFNRVHNTRALVDTIAVLHSELPSEILSTCQEDATSLSACAIK